MALKVVLNKSFENIVHENVEKVFIPAVLGDMTVLENHSPLITKASGDLELFFSETKTETVLATETIISIDKDKIEVFF